MTHFQILAMFIVSQNTSKRRQVCQCDSKKHADVCEQEKPESDSSEAHKAGSKMGQSMADKMSERT